MTNKPNTPLLRSERHDLLLALLLMLALGGLWAGVLVILVLLGGVMTR